MVAQGGKVANATVRPAIASLELCLSAVRITGQKRCDVAAPGQSAPVIWPSCRAKVVFPVPAQPKITIRIICYSSQIRDSGEPSIAAWRISACSGRMNLTRPRRAPGDPASAAANWPDRSRFAPTPACRHSHRNYRRQPFQYAVHCRGASHRRTPLGVSR